jgi:hypothetical protein
MNTDKKEARTRIPLRWSVYPCSFVAKLVPPAALAACGIAILTSDS